MPISFGEALLTVHDDYFIVFVCRFDNDVGVWVVDELLKSFYLFNACLSGVLLFIIDP